MTAVVISQPMLFPWPGFFEQLMLADVYLFLDDVQFSKGSFTNRIQLQMQEETKWMTIPLAGKGAFQPISDLRDDGSDWRKSHLAQLAQSLRGAPFRADALAIAERCYEQKSICDLLIASIVLPADYLKIALGQRRSKTSDLKIAGVSWERVLDLTVASGGSRYLTGHGAANYLDHQAFDARGVAVEYMVYSKSAWPKSAGVFSPYVTVLDLIAHAGPAGAQYLVPATVPWREFLAGRDGSRV